ncbi:MAG: ArgE/DapE family deacylase [Acidimicrobiales bacterium]
MTTDWRARVLEQVDLDEQAMVQAAAALVRTPSVSGTDAEHEVQADLATLFAEDGLEVDHWRLPLAELAAHPDFPGVEVPRTEAWGLVGRLPGVGDGPSLLLDGHIDVVPPGDLDAWTEAPFSGWLDGTTLRGRGACDMKAGVIAARWAVRALRASQVPLRGDVLLATVAGEEDGGLGTFGLLQRGWRADVCVVPEPTALDLVPACAGALTFRLRIRGLATHASRRTEGVSAVEKLGPVLAALRALEAERNAEVDPLLRRWAIAYPIELGTVRSGDWASSVPDLLVAEGRIGVALDESPAEARSALEAAMSDASAADLWLRAHPVEVEWWGGQFAFGRLPETSDLMDRVACAHGHTAATTPHVWGAPYGSDLRLLNGLGGIPTLHYGPGDAALAHAPNESVPLADMATTARTLALLALDICGIR